MNTTSSNRVVIVIFMGMVLVLVIVVGQPHELVVAVKEGQYRKYYICRYICSISYFFNP